MNKTLLDEFAMAALTGWLATYRGSIQPSDKLGDLGDFCYDIAEVMMAERAKRNHQCENASHNAEIAWEKLMMQLVGEDGLGSVAAAVNRLKHERAKLLDALRDVLQQSDEIKYGERMFIDDDYIRELIVNCNGAIPSALIFPRKGKE